MLYQSFKRNSKSNNILKERQNDNGNNNKKNPIDYDYDQRNDSMTTTNKITNETKKNEKKKMVLYMINCIVPFPRSVFLVSHLFRSRRHVLCHVRSVRMVCKRIFYLLSDFILDLLFTFYRCRFLFSVISRSIKLVGLV